MQNKGTLTIKDSSSGVYNSVSGTVNVESGTVSSNTYGIYNYSSSSTANVNGGTISSNTYGIYNAGGTTNIKEGAEIQSDIGIYAAGGRINIGETGTMNSNSPIITGETYGLSVTTAGIVYMYDGQIKGKTGATQGFITYTESGYAVANKIEGEYFVDYLALAGTVNTVAEVNGVSYSNLQSAINSIIGEETQTIKLTNIDATGSGVGKITSTTGTAIINSGTLTLGQDDGTVNQDFITIEGQIYGIETTGELNFYDGTINGSSAVSGTVTNRPSGYVIRTTTVNGKERYYLTI